MFRRTRNRRAEREARELREQAALLSQQIPDSTSLSSPAPVAAPAAAGTPAAVQAPAGETFLPEDLRVVPQEMVGRMMPYPMPLLVDGSPRVCAQCGANRDWLVLNVGPHVYLRCRCAHEWHEPALTVAWYEQHCGPTQEVFSSREDAIASHGFDGMLRGIYLH